MIVLLFIFSVNVYAHDFGEIINKEVVRRAEAGEPISSWNSLRGAVADCTKEEALPVCNYKAIEGYLSGAEFSLFVAKVDKICSYVIERSLNKAYLSQIAENKKITPKCLQLTKNRIEIIEYQEL